MWTVLGVLAGVAVVFLAAAGGDRAAAKWDPGAALQVDAVIVDGAGAPQSVTLSWPDPTGAVTSYEIRRDGELLDTVGGADRTYIDRAPLDGAPVPYTLTALAGSDTTGTLSTTVRVPDPSTGCTLLWTGSASNVWGDQRNWTPIGGAGSVGSARVPTDRDHVCIDHSRNLPVTVAAPGAVAGQVTGTWFRPETIDVTTGGDLKVFGPSTIPAVIVSGGNLQFQDDTRLLWAAGRPELTLGGGELQIETVVEIVRSGTDAIQGQIEVVPDTTTTIDGGRLVTQSLRMDDGGTTELVGSGGAVLVATVNSYFEGTTTLRTGAGGASLQTGFLEARGGDADLDWTVGAADTDLRVTVRTSAALDLADVQALGPADQRWDNVDLDVRGQLVLAETLAVVDGRLELDAATSDLRSGGNPATLADFVEAELFSLRGARTVRLPGDLTVNGLFLQDGVTLEIAGELLKRSGDFDRIDIDRSVLRVGTRSRTPQETSVQLGREVQIAGDLDVAGDLVVAETVDAVGYADVVFLDDLTLEPTSSVTVGADGDAADESTNVKVEGTLRLDGELIVNVDEPLPDGVDIPLFETDRPPEGDFDDVQFNGSDTDGLEVEVDDDGIRLVDTGGGPGGPTCDTPPKVNEMAVSGCWEQTEFQRWTTSADLIVAPDDTPAIGALEFVPDREVDLTLDLAGAAPELVATHRSGERPSVRVEARFTPAVGPEQTIPLGSLSVDWVLDGTAHRVDLATLFDLPLDGVATVIGQGPWVLQAPARLPGILEAEVVPVSFPLEDGVTAPTAPGLDLGVMTLGDVSGVDLSYTGSGVWALSTPAAGLAPAFIPTINGTLEYDSGQLSSGLLTFGSFAPGRLGRIEPLVEFDSVRSEWRSRAVDASSQPLVLYPELGSAAPADGARVKLVDDLDLGVTVLEDMDLRRAPTGWDLIGTSRDLVTTSAIQTTQRLVFAPSVLAEGKVTVRISGSPLSANGPVSLEVDPARRIPGLPEGSTVFAVSGTSPAGGINGPVSGTIAITPGRATALEVSAPVAVGALGRGQATLRSTDVPGDFVIGGDVPGEPAPFDAQGETVELVGAVTLVNGEATGGAVRFTALPFGPLTLDAPAFSFLPGGAVDLIGTLGGQSVTGRVDVVGGNLLGGAIDLPEFDLGGWITVPGARLDVLKNGGTNRFLFDTPRLDSDILKQIELVFTDGFFADGSIQLGDVAGGPDLTPIIADLQGLLPVGGFNLDFDENRERWRVSGFLEDPAVAILGELDLMGGDFEAGTLTVNGARLGTLAELDLTLTVDGTNSFAVAGTVRGDAFSGDRTVSGSADFAGGQLVAGSLQLGAFPIGDLAIVENFSLVWSTDEWAVAGTVTNDSGSTAASGAATFEDGMMRTFDVDIAGLVLGPLTFDRFELSLDTIGSDDYTVSGEVRGPNRTDARGAAATAFSGEATLADGELTALTIQVPFMEIAGIAYIEDLLLEYEDDGARVQLSGGGQITSADEAQRTAATVDLELRNGVVLSARVATDRLSLGGLITIDDLVLLFDRTAGLTCAGQTGGARNEAVYAASGTLADGSELTGCLLIDGRRLIGGELLAERIVVGELFRIDDLMIEFAATNETTILVLQPDGTTAPASITATTFELDGDLVAGDLPAVAVTGGLVLTDGGLASLELSIPRLPISSTVEFTNLRLDYVDGARWDGQVDTSFTLAGNAVHDQGTTSAAGSLQFNGDGSLDAATLMVDDLPLGPFALETFEFQYRGGDTTSWTLGGTVTSPSTGQSAAITGSATLQDGRLLAAQLDVPQLSVGELVLISNASVVFERDGDDQEIWRASATVSGLDQANDPAAASFEIVVASDGSLRSGLIIVERVSWGGLFQVTDLRLSGAETANGFAWDLTAEVQVGDGTQAALTGSLVLVDGVVESGSFSTGPVELDEWATIERLEVSADRTGDVTEWSGTVQVTRPEGPSSSGRADLTFSNGRLATAQLEIGDVAIAELLTLEELSISFEDGRRWAASALVVDEDGTSSLAGELRFRDGALTGGFLELADFQFGPVEVTAFRLDVDTTRSEGQNVCGVADPGGAGSRYVVDATVAAPDGGTSSLAGRLRLVDGAVSEGILCGDDLTIADMFTLDSLLLAYSTTGAGAARTISFDGSATVVSQETSGVGWSASVGFDLRDGQLQRFDLMADGFRFAELISLTDVELAFDRSAATTWSLAATVNRPGPNSTLAGTLSVDDGRIVGGQLQIGNVTFGDLFTLSNLQITYHGRRAATNVAGLPPFVNRSATTDCAGTPADGNVPTGTGGLTGAESLFAISATVDANGDTFDAAGSLSFSGGRLTTFDVSIACFPLGNFKTLEGLRIAARPALSGGVGSYVFDARLRGDDDVPSGAGGTMVFTNGRLTGGELRMSRVPLGVVQIERLIVTLGQSPNGNSTYGLIVEIEDDDGGTIGGGGSLTMNDGQLVAGAIAISELPMLDLFTIEDLDISLDNSQPNRTEFSGGADVVLGGGGTAGMDIDLTFENGRLVAGAFAAQQIDLFSVIPIGAFSLSYDSTTTPPSWSGSMAASLPGTNGSGGPGIVVGVEITRGKLTSGVFGFDADGDGDVDGLNANGEAPASGGGDFTGFPLKALYLRYCAPNSTAAFCDPIDNDTWEGRIGFELPTGSGAALDASLRLRNGRFEAASLDVSGLSIPLYPGVFLNRLAAALQLEPNLEFGGLIGVTVGLPQGFDIIEIDAELSFSEQPDPDPNEDPDDYEPEYYRFYVGGEARLLELPIQLNSFIDIQTRGLVGVGGTFDIDLIGKNTLYVNGGAEGWVFDSSALGLVNPRDPDVPLTGPGAQMRGFVAAGILNRDVASAEFVANNVGAAACAELLGGVIRVGAGLYWSGGTKLTCDLGKFEIAGVSSSGGIFINNLVGLANSETEFSTFVVPVGEPVLGVEVEGVGGDPDVELIAPDGRAYDLDDDGGNIIVHDGGGKRWFVIGDPVPGEWRVQARAGSVPLGEVIVSGKLPDVDVTGSVASSGAGFVVDWAASEIAGQQIVFVERAAGGTTGDADADYTEIIGTAVGGDGVITFTPGGAPADAGTTREVVAQVLQDGFLRKEVVLGTFEVPAATVADAPRNLVATETAAGAQVMWEVPASDGGRAITGYQVSSTAGWSVDVPATQTSAYLPIPGMTLGEVVPVFVRARTGAGLGEVASTSFTSNQTTGLQYAESSPLTTDNAAVDSVAPTVTIEQANGQDDPTGGTPISFAMTFSEPVTGFSDADVVIGGTAGATTATVIGGGANYTVLVTGMANDGTVTASLSAGAAEDPAGNPSAASTSVDNMVDFAIVAAPLQLAVSDDIVVPNDAGTGGATVVYPPAVATGGLAPATVTCTPASGTVFAIGTTTVSCTAVDAGTGDGQQRATGTFRVTVEDVEVPVIASMPAVNASSVNGGSVPVTFSLPSASDNSGVAPTVSCAPASGSAFPVGTTSVTCTATDAAGNTATTRFDVRVMAAALPSTGGGSSAPWTLAIGVVALSVGVLLLGGTRRRRRASG